MSAPANGEEVWTGEVREHRFKRAMDLIAVVGAHVALFPLFAVIWVVVPLAIWLDDRGPVFFRQMRVGKNGWMFEQLKFRSMTVGADRIGPGWTSAVDPLVTRVGRVLQRTALDEIPQMVNIWRGEMSWVGPRPLPLDMHNGYVANEPKFVRRLAVRPGLTGPAAINLPRHCSAQMRLQEDLYYIEHTSLWLDVKLIVQSVWLTLTGQWGSGPRRAREPDSDTNDPSSQGEVH